MKVNFFFVITFFILSLGFSQTSYKMDRLIKPENLKIGDTISIIAPSGVLKDYDKYMDKSINLMESWGLNVVLGSSIYDNYGHFSSADINREKDFQNAIDDNKIKAIWCARGGYGARVFRCSSIVRTICFNKAALYFSFCVSEAFFQKDPVVALLIKSRLIYFFINNSIFKDLSFGSSFIVSIACF